MQAPLPAPISLFVSTAPYSEARFTPDLGWSEWCTDLQIHQLAGDHNDVLSGAGGEALLGVFGRDRAAPSARSGGMTTAPESEVDIGSSAMPPAADPRDIALTIADIVAGHARDRGGAIAVQDRDRTLTYAELAALAGRIGALVEQAVPAQGPVGILLPASASYVAAIVAMLARGIPYVPMDEFPGGAQPRHRPARGAGSGDRRCRYRAADARDRA